MSEQTKQSDTYSWLPWAVAASVTILIAVSMAFLDVLPENISLMPWDRASGVDTMRAINEFSDGNIDMGNYWNARWWALGGIILFFIIGPSMWIFTEINNEKKPEPSDVLNKGLGWYVGTVLVALVLLYAVPGTAVKAYIFQNTWESADKSRTADQIRGDLLTMGLELSEQYYLSDGKVETLNLKHLNSKPNDAYTYVLEKDNQDSVMTVYGIGNIEVGNPEFKNANGQKGKMQLTLEVDPDGEIIQFVNENTNKP
ncbi:hypothetical protein [Fodinibius sp.]|uniref:hypothetical protein n=1 Tax=Fodinibius sp. TaxID=1872440 RepID=UPI002ACDDA8E|nr:hypothetical protein [Fodinibius sp.]MDZ7659566.1 hypothetical protein [Fodinibius sp.]